MHAGLLCCGCLHLCCGCLHLCRAICPVWPWGIARGEESKRGAPNIGVWRLDPGIDMPQTRPSPPRCFRSCPFPTAQADPTFGQLLVPAHASVAAANHVLQKRGMLREAMGWLLKVHSGDLAGNGRKVSGLD